MTKWVVVIGLFICIVIGAVVLVIVPGPLKAPTTPASLDDLIKVTYPTPGTAIDSPLQVLGSARGSWFFEAQFPVELVSACDINPLWSGPAHAIGDWMTEAFVPFSVDVYFTMPTNCTQGTLILNNDNPSGDPARQKEIRIPVRF